MPASDRARDRALESLLEREGPRLLAFARRSCGDGSDAEDIVQETFVRAVRSWHQLEDPGQARAWLYAIARRVCQRLHRRRAGEPKRLEPLSELLPRPEATVPHLAAAAPDDPHRDRLRAEARELVERAVAALPDRFRQALVLADVAGLTVAQNAAPKMPPMTITAIRARYRKGIPGRTNMVAIDMIDAATRLSAIPCGLPA